MLGQANGMVMYFWQLDKVLVDLVRLMKNKRRYNGEVMTVSDTFIVWHLYTWRHFGKRDDEVKDG